ncbi:hypothetical protein BTHI11S_01879 [Bosea thiooxidans]
MSPSALLSVFLSLTVIGLPIAFVLLGTGIAMTLADPDILEVAYIQNIIVGTQSFPLIAIPLFILAGELMNISGITAAELEKRAWRSDRRHRSAARLSANIGRPIQKAFARLVAQSGGRCPQRSSDARPNRRAQPCARPIGAGP